MKFRKKPVIIDAIKFEDATNCLIELSGEFGLNPVRVDYAVNPPQLVIETLEGEMRGNVGDWIIKGVNNEFYPCKPDIFAKTYDSIENDHLNFGDALVAIKNGSRCARNGWNGKKQYIELAVNISYVNSHNEVINADHLAIGNCAIAFVGTSGVQLGWLASQADMLAEGMVS